MTTKNQAPMGVEISSLSATKHYLAAAQFWENRAKLLQHQLDETMAERDQLAAQLKALAPEPKPKPEGKS